MPHTTHTMFRWWVPIHVLLKVMIKSCITRYDHFVAKWFAYYSLTLIQHMHVIASVCISDYNENELTDPVRSNQNLTENVPLDGPLENDAGFCHSCLSLPGRFVFINVCLSVSVLHI